MHTAARGEHPGWGERAPLARRPLPTPQPREAPPVTREAASQPEMLCRRAGDGGGLTRTLLQSASQGDLLLGRMGVRCDRSSSPKAARPACRRFGLRARLLLARQGCGCSGERAALALPGWEGAGWWAAGGSRLSFGLWLAAGAAGSGLAVLPGVGGELWSLPFCPAPQPAACVSSFGSVLIGNGTRHLREGLFALSWSSGRAPLP